MSGFISYRQKPAHPVSAAVNRFGFGCFARMKAVPDRSKPSCNHVSLHSQAIPLPLGICASAAARYDCAGRCGLGVFFVAAGLIALGSVVLATVVSVSYVARSRASRTIRGAVGIARRLAKQS
jgi:hypothetical protein